MSLDAQLQALRRQAELERTDEARARLLAGRLRAGDLGLVWLFAAARLGDPSARIAIDRPVRPVTSIQLATIIEEQLDRDGCTRVALALAKARLPEWTTAFPDDKRPAEAIDAAQAWLDAPGSDRADRCAAAARGARDAADEAGPEATWQALNAAQLAAASAACASASRIREVRTEAIEAWRLCKESDAVAREALTPWALEVDRPDEAEPPKDLRPGPRELESHREKIEASRRRRAAFEDALGAAETKKRATSIRKRLRAKELERDRVKLAASLGDPAAWLVVKPDPDEEPDLEPPESGEAMGARLTIHVGRFAKKLPRAEIRRLMFLKRLHDPDGDANEPGPAWPEWSRDLIARIALAVGSRCLERFEAAVEGEQAPRTALDAAYAFFTAPGEETAARVADAAKTAGRVASRKLPPEAKAAARAVSWAAQLVVRARAAPKPRLNYAKRDLLGQAYEAGLSAQELWDELRDETIGWSLRERDLGRPPRPYAPGEAFAEGETIEHPKFGTGRVVATSRGRMQVAFDGETRTLVHAG